jgi:hypothetical protein
MFKQLFISSVLLTISLGASATTIHLDPGSTALQAEQGPFGYGGRGVIFRAEQDFAMSSFGMDLSFSGNLDFSVDVYATSGRYRGGLISQTTYSGLSDDGSDFFTLAHNQAFSAGETYEVIMRFSDPGVAFRHYNFQNYGSDVANGIAIGSSILLLDGDQSFTNFKFGVIVNDILDIPKITKAYAIRDQEEIDG